MEYSFTWSAFLFGLFVLLAGTALTIWYRPIADNMGSGVASYERYRMWGLIAIGVGFLVMLSIHTLLISWLFGMFFNR